MATPPRRRRQVCGNLPYGNHPDEVEKSLVVSRKHSAAMPTEKSRPEPINSLLVSLVDWLSDATPRMLMHRVVLCRIPCRICQIYFPHHGLCPLLGRIEYNMLPQEKPVQDQSTFERHWYSNLL
jgi:hypothetical protein